MKGSLFTNYKNIDMKYFIILWIFIVIISCKKQDNTKEDNINDHFEKSYKEKIKDGELSAQSEQIDSIRKIYSNYAYSISFDSPDNWVYDNGVSKHTILRTYDADSAIVFTINVIETDAESKENVWDLYDMDSVKVERDFKNIIKSQVNSEIHDYSIKKTYIKNFESLSRKFEYIAKDQDFKYENTGIIQQVCKGKFIYTFSLFVPSQFYSKKPKHYNDLFLKVNFLNDEENTSKIINSK
jgi:hypothetical protein